MAFNPEKCGPCRALLAALVLCGLLTTPARAGLYGTAETLADLPSRWRGFLLDQRMLRNAAVRPAVGAAASPLRHRYDQEAERLAGRARTRPLTSDEAADLGALYVRLGEVGRALAVLRPAYRADPRHFRLAANLGTAWQLQGDLAQADACLREAVRLAPPQWKRAEELHLRLVRRRAREPRGAAGLDDLFGVRFVGPSGRYEPGRLAEEQRRRLPADAVALAQHLALVLPADGRLLWQLAELAACHGDVATAAAMMDGCVTEFGLRDPELRAHRLAVRAVAGRPGTPGTARTGHQEHAGLFKPRSPRPLVHRTETKHPPVHPTGINPLLWEVIAETTLDRQYRPTFSPYLKELAGKRVELHGFMQPLEEGRDLAAFLLIEYPVGCWYCEMPETTGLVLVELPEGRTCTFRRGLVRVVGRLSLNATDPENFLYTLHDAELRGAD